ncbi:MAG: response regulator [Opitutaceae bacterium]|nr:response regulator [Opitutaceae bacterium]
MAAEPSLPAAAPPRILVVEDESIVVRDICQQLTDLGFAPVADTRTGEEAVELAQTLRPDLVLMDIQLAGEMDGITAARTIRERLHLPVVFLTAFAGRETLERAREAEPFGYIIKPFAEQDLRTVVEMALYKHRTEVRLRESEARLRAITDSAQDAIVMIDARGRVTFWNPAAGSIFGFGADEVLGREVHVLLADAPPREAPGQTLAEVLRTGADRAGGRTLELPARRKDGTRIEISLSLSPASHQGEHQTVAVIRDITRQKQTEAKMRLQSAALEAADSSVVITDRRGNIEWVNPAFCRVTGYTREEAIGQNPRVLKSGFHRADFYRAMWRTVTAGRSWQGEFINRRKDGSLFTESVTITPVHDGHGDIAHFIAIKHDISALKQSLADLKSAHTELAAKNLALDKALLEAKAAAEAKSAFLAMMSHELRTPMNGVIGMASLLRETAPLTEEQRDFIETINASGNTLLALINDVLDYSKIESNHLELDHVPFDLRRCLEETLETVAVRAREKHLDLALEIDPAVPAAVVGDPVRLRQVLTNLEGNAVKFTERGEVVVEVGAAPAGKGQVRLHFRVRDTGIGIPPEKRERLFKAFSQVDVSTTRLYGGTGLGLVISQRLIGLMGGEIKVDSIPGQGSVFHFEITVPTTAEIEPIDPDRLTRELDGRVVLIVDDNATNRRIFATHLQQAGCTVETADSAAAALDGLRRPDWPDLIITDMLMPGMDGLDFVLHVRALEKAANIAPATPVIMISSGGYQPSDPRVARVQLAAALSKPVRQMQLYETAARACHGHAPRHPRVAPKPAPVPPPPLSATLPRRILLAEDNLVNRKLALAMLGRLGYGVDTVENGVEAVAACRAQNYDLIFMDVQMPEMDGLTATRQIRTLPGPPPWIIAMTANALEGDREVCLAAGMNDYLPKPVRLDDLRRVLAQSQRPPTSCADAGVDGLSSSAFAPNSETPPA